MAVNVKNLSASKLKELKNGEAINIRYVVSQEADDSTSRIILEQLPKQVATAFSTTWAAMFPAVNKMSLKEMSQPKRTTVTIIGGDLDTIHTILTWVSSCCDGKGMQRFPSSITKPFTTYYFVKEAANSMGIQVLSDEMDRRLTNLKARHIHSEDVRAMYLCMPADHPVLKEIADHVANLIWAKNLKAFGAYRTLREEIPTFDQHLNTILDGKKGTPRPKSKPAARPREPETKNVTLHLPVVRKGTRGRPAYAGLSLAEVGVNRRDFVGNGDGDSNRNTAAGTT